MGTEARRRRHRNADRPCARDGPLSTRRSITFDGDQTAPGIRKARAAGSSPATGHARPSRTLRPSCARARRRARHRVACPWVRRPTRSHRPLPHSLACSARPGGASAGVGNESLREPHARHLIFRDRSQAGHGAFAEPSPSATDQTDDVRASGEVEVVAVSDPRSRRLTNSLPVVRWRRVVPLGDPWSGRDDRDPRWARARRGHASQASSARSIMFVAFKVSDDGFEHRSADQR